MNREIEILDIEDVVAVLPESEGRFILGNTLRGKQLLKEYKAYVGKSNGSNCEMFTEGIECEVLRHDGKHQGWRRGKIKFVIQFEPNEAESAIHSLDDIRQQMEQININNSA